MSVHIFGPWRRPIGQLKLRQCCACGHIETWAEYLWQIRTKP